MVRSPSDPLTIVMYHYVRDLPRTRYPRIKARLTQDFIGQLDYLQTHYSIVSVEDVISAYVDGHELPPRPCLLTFDDGFIDHFVTVFPLLEERGLPAGFYPPAAPILEHRLDDVHRLHLVLAAVDDPDNLAERVLRLIAPYRKEYQIASDEELYREFAAERRFDTRQVTFVKRLLNKGLPRDVSRDLCGQLFREVVSEDEASIAREHYMDLYQLRCMARHGMHIGGHGSSHSRMTALSEEQLGEEIRGTVDFLSRVYGESPGRWVMCYPYGETNESIVSLLRAAGCSLGLATVPQLAPRDTAVRFELPRLDTNDLPTSGGAEPCHWTKMVIQREAPED